MITNGLKNSSALYADWMDRPVVLRVTVRQCQVPMACRILGETAGDVRVRIHPGWEMEIEKNLIVGVEDAVTTVKGNLN